MNTFDLNNLTEDQLINKLTHLINQKQDIEECMKKKEVTRMHLRSKIANIHREIQQRRVDNQVKVVSVTGLSAQALKDNTTQK